MSKTESAAQGNQVRVIGRFCGTPVVVKGATWLPLVEGAVAFILARWAGNMNPARTRAQRWRLGLMAMPVVVGSEWVHNFAHAAAARVIGKPMDALRISWGTPLCIYLDTNDPGVAPREHILRALGGPLANALLWMVARRVRRTLAPGSEAWEVARAAVTTNAFLSTASLLPIPFLDGGPLLKWSLVAGGQRVEQADANVQQVNGPLAAGMAAGAVLAARKRRTWLAALLGQLAVVALGVALGWIKEPRQEGVAPL